MDSFYFHTAFYQIKIYKLLKFVLHKVRTYNNLILTETNYNNWSLHLQTYFVLINLLSCFAGGDSIRIQFT